MYCLTQSTNNQIRRVYDATDGANWFPFKLEGDVCGRKLHGVTCDANENLTTLTVLDSSYNSIPGSIPSSIGGLTAINEIILNSAE